MSPRRFWRTTPALFNTLSKVHSDVKNPNGDGKPAVEKIAQTVEEIPFLI